MTLTRAYRDPIAWEETLGVRSSSLAWRATLKALYGTPLDADELELYRQLSGGVDPSPHGALELLVVAGRRGGKSETIARVAVFEAIHGGHGIALALGQLGLIAVISPLREQSQEIMGYARGLCGLRQVKRYLDGPPGRDEIRFKTGIAIRIMTADAVNVSGPTLVMVIRDEWAKWPGDESVMPDHEIENSLRPALAPVVGAPPRRIFGITSAYLKEGLAYETDRDCFAQSAAPVMVVRGATEVFNPNIDPAYLASERKRDKRAFEREYLGQWQDAVVEGYFAEVLDQCIDLGRASSEPRDEVEYVAAMDPAWKGDNFALAIAHRERGGDGRMRTVVDLVRVWSPRGGVLSTEATLGDIAAIVQPYRTNIVYTDQAAAPAVIEAGRCCGLLVIEVPWTGGVGPDSKASKFRRIYTAMGDGLVRLPDDAAAIREFSNIASKLLRSGGEQFEARSGHDDRVHAVVLAVTRAMALRGDYGRPPEEQARPVPGSLEAHRLEAQKRKERVKERIRRQEEANDDDALWVLGEGI